MPTPAPAPAGAGGGRRRWVLPLIAIVAALALIAGLVIWAPWVERVPKVPATVRAQSPTPTSVVIQWAPPITGPTVDSYSILRGGAAVGSVPGTATSYKDLGLVPATAYRYSVVAVSGDYRSAPSAVLVVKTPTPPTSEARLQGTWYVDSKVLTSTDPPPAVGRTASDTWKLTPICKSGACAVVLSGNWTATPIKMTLNRAGGGAYTGVAHPAIFRCLPNKVPMPDTLRIRITVRGASMQSQTWAVTSWSGTMSDAVQETPSGNGSHCNASTLTASLNAIP